MNVLRTTAWAAMSVATFCALGCDRHEGERPRQESVAAPQALPPVEAPQPQYVIVQQAPPAVIVESRPTPPSAAHIWIDGYWNWDNQRYTWQAGRYEVPPEAGVVWVGPRYDREGQGYRYSPGQWKKNGPGESRGREPGGR